MDRLRGQLMRGLLGLTLLLLAAGCGPGGERSLASAARTEVVAGPTGSSAVAVVDSVRPIAEELARFRASAGGGAVHELQGGTTSRDELVAAFARALAGHDTAALAALQLDVREFAWLYYPFTVYTHPPFRQAPEVVWLLTRQNSAKGMKRLLDRFGGHRAEPRATCAPPEPQDLNLLHADCRVRVAGDTAARRLFGTILERNGRFKFVSFANEL